MSFHRAEFHGVLLNRLPSSCGTFPSKRLESYTQQPEDKIVLYFQDGSTATCDILLGAYDVKTTSGPDQMQAHTMTPFLGAGARQAIEVSFCIFFSVM